MASQYPSSEAPARPHSRILRAGCLMLALLWGITETSAQESFYWYPIFKPNYFWAPSAGYGAGIGLNGRNLFLDGDAGRSRHRIQQFRQSTSIGWATSKPQPGWTGWLVVTNVVRHLREEFYGEGPGALVTSRQIIHRNRATAEVRRSQALGGSAWIQAAGGIRLDHVLNFHPDAPGSTLPVETTADLARIEAEGARAALQGSLDLGASLGDVELQLGSVLRFRDGSVNHAVVGLVSDRTWALAQNRSITLRLLIDQTVRRSDDTPYYFLPMLDGKLAPGWGRTRFYGNDRLVFGATYVHPIFEILKSHAYEAVLNLGLSQVYDDLFSDFSGRITLAPDRAAFDGRVPLEPTLGLGGRFVSRQSGEEIVSLTFGFSAEGYQIGSLRIVQRFSDWFPALR